MNNDNHKFDRISYQNEYNKKKYDRVTIMLPKGKHDELKQLAKNSGISVNKYILAAIELYKSGKEN